jgi:hypothetical protein
MSPLRPLKRGCTLTPGWDSCTYIVVHRVPACRKRSTQHIRAERVALTADRPSDAGGSDGGGGATTFAMSSQSAPAVAVTEETMPHSPPPFSAIEKARVARAKPYFIRPKEIGQTMDSGKGGISNAEPLMASMVTITVRYCDSVSLS